MKYIMFVFLCQACYNKAMICCYMLRATEIHFLIVLGTQSPRPRLPSVCVFYGCPSVDTESQSSALMRMAG